jgi:hypothetical protein
MIPQEALDYIDFRGGSYWIFRDSVSGALDSNVVTSSRHIMEGNSRTNDCGDIVYDTRFENIKNIVTRFDSLKNIKLQWEVSFINDYKMNGSGPLDEFTVAPFGDIEFGYPFDRTFHDGPYSITEFKSDSLIVNGTTFYNILYFKAINTLNVNDYIFNAYSKGIGLIQATSYTGIKRYSNYYVIRYKIK